MHILLNIQIKNLIHTYIKQKKKKCKNIHILQSL